MIEISSGSEPEDLRVNDQPIQTRNPDPVVAQPSRKRSRAEAEAESSDEAGTPGQKGLKQGTLFSFGCKKVTAEEARSQRQSVSKQLGTDYAALRAEAERKKRERAERKRRDSCERQRRFRQRQAEAKEKSGDGRKRRRTLVENEGLVTEAGALPQIAELSHPTKTWKKSRQGKKNGVVQMKYSRINWFVPFLWAPIARLAPRVAWSPTMIANMLKTQMPDLYSHLHPGTVVKWMSKRSRNRWSKKTLKKVEQGGRLKGTGRVGVLTPFPQLVDEIKTKLMSLREAGVPLDRVLARTIILALVKEREPQLLSTFKCTEVSRLKVHQFQSDS